jgi:hypothetical protein
MLMFLVLDDVDLSGVGFTKFINFYVEIVDPASDYLDLLEVKKKLLL